MLPANDAVDQPISLDFTWTKAVDQTSVISGRFGSKRRFVKSKNEISDPVQTVGNYWFELTRDTSGTFDFSNDQLTDTTTHVDGLDNSTDYWWRVSAKNEAGWGIFTDWFKFATIVDTPNVVSLLKPVSNSVGLAIPLTLTWTKDSLSEHYQIQIFDDSTQSNILIDSSIVNDTSYVLNNLNPLSTYYWRVRSVNSATSGVWSELWQFKTLGNPNSISLIYPPDNSENMPLSINFVWSKASEPTESIIPFSAAVKKYKFELFSDTLSNPVIIDSALTDTSKVISNLKLSSTYFWRVSASNEFGWGDFTSWNIFSTYNDSFGSPEIFSIIDIPDDQGEKLRLKIKASKFDSHIDSTLAVKSYTVWRSNNESTWDALSSFNAVQDSIYNYVAMTLIDSVPNSINWSHFRVSAHTINPYIFFYSKIDSGYSIDNLFPSTPAGFIAENMGNITVQLTWNKNTEEDISHYNIYHWHTEDITPDSAYYLTSVTDTTYMDSEVMESVYTYIITSVDIHGNESPPTDYIMIIIVGVTDEDGTPKEYSLAQNYPNPFNPSTIIKYALPKESNVKLSIYDVLGREIIKLVDEVQNTGYYEIPFDAQNLGSGIYFYRITAGDYVSVKKMLLVK